MSYVIGQTTELQNASAALGIMFGLLVVALMAGLCWWMWPYVARTVRASGCTDWGRLVPPGTTAPPVSGQIVSSVMWGRIGGRSKNQILLAMDNEHLLAVQMVRHGVQGVMLDQRSGNPVLIYEGPGLRRVDIGSGAVTIEPTLGGIRNLRSLMERSGWPIETVTNPSG